MPTFHYSATDADGGAVQGELEAAGLDEALATLAAQGLAAELENVREVSAPPVSTAEPAAEGETAAGKRAGKLSAEDATEAAAHLGELARAELPLASGLRAMAEELLQQRVGMWLGYLAERLELGEPLEEALGHVSRGLPEHVGKLIQVGARSGRLAEIMEEFVALRRNRHELMRRLRLTLSYPFVLAVLLVSLFVFVGVVVTPAFVNLFDDFGTELPAFTRAIIWMTTEGSWWLLGLLLLLVWAVVSASFLPRPYWLRRAIYLVPIIGPLWRAAGLVEFTKLMAILTAEQVPLPEALRLAADGVSDPALARSARDAATDVESGRGLAESMADYWQFPASLAAMVRWGERTSDIAGTFRAAGEMYDGRVQIQNTFFESIFPLFVLILIAIGAGAVYLGLMMPLVSLVQALT